MGPKGGPIFSDRGWGYPEGDPWKGPRGDPYFKSGGGGPWDPILGVSGDIGGDPYF